MVKFEDYAREASRALSASGRSVEVPALSEMWTRRRRTGLVLGSVTIVVVVVAGTIGVIASLGGMNTSTDGRIVADDSRSGLSVPSQTVPAEGGGGVLFGPPRIEKADTVEFPITLLDGTRLILTLPHSLADDVDGLVPGGAASWRHDPCCARSLEVIYGSVEDLYGGRQPDVAYEDADGSPVGFYVEEDDLDYLVFQYGSWVVRAWDDDAEGRRFTEENRELFALLMRGRESSDGFLVLDPDPPMTIGPGDGPDATLTTGTREEGLVGVFQGRDCASEGPSANPDLVTSAGNLVSFAEESGMSSICWPEASFLVWVARLDLSESELEAIELDYATGPPVEETSTTTSTTTVSTTTLESTTTSKIQATGSWSVVADHPVVGRVFPIVVWTGNEVIVWGGEKPSERAWHADGAAFDPATGTWRDLAESPLSSRSEHVAAWTGEEVIICCGRIVGEGASAAAYNPAADEWREVAAPPISPAFAEAVWTGEEMLVFGGVGGGGTSNLVGAAAYNPATNSWRELADLPYGLERTADAAMGQGVVYAWPSTGQDSTDLPLAYDITSDEWLPLPPPPSPRPSAPSLVWTGDELFAYGAGSNAEGNVIGIAVSYNPEAQTWDLAESPPFEPATYGEGTDGSQKATWVDGEVYVWTGWVGTDWAVPITRVGAYDPVNNSWRELEPAPIPAQGLWHEPIVWTGSQLITYTDPMLVYTP
jgi:hypothetical protein